MPCGDDVAHRLTLLLNIAVQNIVQHLIRRQTVLIGLVVAQFRRWRTREDVVRNDVARAKCVGLIAPVANAVYKGFVNILSTAYAPTISPYGVQ